MKLKKAKFLLLSAIAGLTMGIIGAVHAGNGCTSKRTCDSNGNCSSVLTCCWEGTCTTSEIPF